ncbi:MAG: hypothetical protein K0S74_716 [Chlamydiales bacterium]|jgi:hypothetical protein|nr:hypothetical protein [Chlamydiales bacterium]
MNSLNSYPTAPIIPKNPSLEETSNQEFSSHLNTIPKPVFEEKSSFPSPLNSKNIKKVHIQHLKTDNKDPILSSTEYLWRTACSTTNYCAHVLSKTYTKWGKIQKQREWLSEYRRCEKDFLEEDKEPSKNYLNYSQTVNIKNGCSTITPRNKKV